MAGIRALPRSLDPLPDESLAGYLLRLAHRLALTPARLAVRTGLATAGRFGTQVPSHRLIRLPDPVREAFAQTARLSTDEVDGLCLNALSSRYPLPAPRGDDNLRPVNNTRLSRWIFAPHTRYCPQCLAGNDTPIQHEHGGAWRKTWHLPVVFACIDHRRLLEHLCPHCRQPVHGPRPGSPVLLPNMRNGGLHPSQCRAAAVPGNGRRIPLCCGTRLDDSAIGDALEAGEAVLALQRRILALLDPHGPDIVASAGRDTTPPRYFTDLRMLAALASSSWPALRHMVPSAAMAEAIDRHVDHQRRTSADLQGRPPATRRRILDTPPPDAAASAGLIAVADRLLGLNNPDEVREHLQPLVPTSTRQARRSLWGTLADRVQPNQSDGLRQACQPLLRTFTRAEPHARREPQRQTRFGPQHVPAFLPEHWYTRHFHHVHGVNPKLVRRTTTAQEILDRRFASGEIDADTYADARAPPGRNRTQPAMNWAHRRWLPLTVLAAATAILVASIVWAAVAPAWSPVGAMIGPAVPGNGPVRSMAAADRAAARFARPWGLTVGEVVQFDNGFYAELVDPAGERATEVLVDPTTGTVGLEWGRR